MSEDSDDDAGRRLGPRALLALMVIGAIATASLGVALQQNTGEVAYEDGVTLNSTNGLEIELQTGGGQLQSGNPFAASNAIQIRNTTFIAASDGITTNLTVRNSTHVGVGDLSGGRIEINNSATKHSYGTTDISSVVFNRQLVLDNSTNETELSYSDTGSPTIDVYNTNESQGRGIVALDDNGQVLDAAAVDSSGAVRFDELPSGNYNVNIDRGIADLVIYNKSAPSTKVSQAIRVRVFNQDGTLVRERTVNDGTVSLDGLDQSAEYTFTFRDVGSPQQYRDATVKIETLYQQTQVYLEPKSEPVAYVTFKLNDLSGDFPGSTTDIIIKQPIRKDFNGDGTVTTEYQAVAGDTFGQDDQTTLALSDNTEHRITISNTETSSSRQMGTYRTAGNDTVTFRIEDTTLGGNGSSADIDEGWSADAAILNNSAGKFVEFEYVDAENLTTKVDWRLRFRDNGTQIDSGTLNGPLGEGSTLIDITNHSQGISYELNYTTYRNGSVYDRSIPLGSAGEVDLPMDQRWTGILGLVLIVASGGLAVLISSAAGALVMTIVASLLTMLGIVSIPSAAIGMAGGIAVLAVMGGGT